MDYYRVEKTLAKTTQKLLLTAFNRLGGILYHPTPNNPLKQKIMNTKEFLQDLYDVINNNSNYITIEEFREKYKDFQFQYDSGTRGYPCIEVWDEDDNNEWIITAKHVLSDK